MGIDYDAGASEVNQLNRIKLMIATAKKQHDFHFEDPGAGATSASGPTSASGANARTCGCGSSTASSNIPDQKRPVSLGIPVMVHSSAK